jgi:hypothetical protein
MGAIVDTVGGSTLRRVGSPASSRWTGVEVSDLPARVGISVITRHYGDPGQSATGVRAGTLKLKPGSVSIVV